MMNPFDWLRHRTRAAVVEGFCDALDSIDRGDVARLQERIALQLPSPAAAGDTSPPADSDGTTEATAPVARGGKRGAK